MTDQPAGAFCRLPRGSRLFAFAVTGRTAAGDPVAATGTVPAPDRATAEREVAAAMTVAHSAAVAVECWPAADVRVTVFEVRPDRMADVPLSNRYKVYPPARAAGGEG